MSGYIALIQTEVLKMRKKTGTLVMFAAVLILAVLLGVSAFSLSDNKGSDWKTANQKTLEKTQKEYADALKDDADDEEMLEWDNEFYGEQIALYSYSVEHDIPYGVLSVWDMFYQSGVLMNLVVLFAVLLGIAIINDEYTFGTIKLVLTGPFRRNKVLISKKISVTIMTIVLFLWQFICMFVVDFLLFRNLNTVGLEYVNGKVIEINLMTSVINMYLIRLILAMILAWVGMGLAMITRSTTISILGVLVIWGGDVFLKMAVGAKKWYAYTIFPNMNLDVYLQNGHWCALKGDVLKSLVIVLVYLLVFTVIARWFFCKKDVTN